MAVETPKIVFSNSAWLRLPPAHFLNKFTLDPLGYSTGFFVVVVVVVVVGLGLIRMGMLKSVFCVSGSFLKRLFLALFFSFSRKEIFFCRLA